MPRKAAPPDLDTQGGRLMAARLDAGFATRPEAALALDLPKSTYESHENGLRGQRGIPIEYARRYARRFGVSLMWLLTGQGSRASAEAVEIRGYIGAGAEVEEIEGASRFEAIGIDVTDPDEFEWYEVRGDSMRPRVFPGEFIAFERRSYAPAELLRQDCLVFLEDGRRFFKKLNPGSAPGYFDLISYNDDDRPDERVKSVGKVAMIVSRPRRA